MGRGGGEGEESHAKRQTGTYTEGKDGRSRVRVISPKAAGAPKPWKGSVTPSETQTALDCGSQDPDVCVCVLHRLRAWPGERALVKMDSCALQGISSVPGPGMPCLLHLSQVPG